MMYKVRAILGLCVVLLDLKAGAINISAEGEGTASPNLTGKNLIAGKTYTLTAKARAGYRFDHWVVYDNNTEARHEYSLPKLSVTLLNGLLYVKDGTNYEFVGSFDCYFTAHFVPKTIVPGTYIGVNTDIGIDPDAITTYSIFRVSTTGAFSAKAFFDGRWHSFSGKFSEDGTAHSTVLIGNQKIAMNLYFNSDNVAIYTEPEEYDPDSPLNVLSGTLVSHDPRITTYYGGKYSVTISGEDNDTSVPKGDGFAKVSISRDGRLHALGKLADGTPFTQSTPLSAPYLMEWPLFLVLKGGAESLAGTVTFFNSGGPLGGYVIWEKTQQTNDLNYPDGFRRQLAINGSPYLPPKIGNQVLDNSNLLISVDGGTLPIHFSAAATLTSDNRIVINDPTNQIAITIQTDTGLFSGTATPPGQSQQIEFQGALVQHWPPGSLLYDYYGSGFFLQNNLSGRIKIVGPPPPLETTIISNPTNLYAGYSGGFTGRVEGNPSAYYWDFGDGTIVSNSASAFHTWMEGGDFEVKLRAFDDANQAGVTARCIVHVTLPPLQVSLNESEVILTPGEAHEFAGQITGVVDWYLWTFGDGYSVAGLPPSDLHAPAITHFWSSPGDYAVVLSGFNAYATGGMSATSIVHVVEAPRFNFR